MGRWGENAIWASGLLGSAVESVVRKVKRPVLLAAGPFDGVHAGGYVFQIEMTFRASRAGAGIAEVPITFRDRRVGQSKMNRRIIVEALVVVVQLRAEELRDRLRRRPGS